MQPVPLTGTTTKYGVYHRLISFAMQPVPLTGTATVGLFLLVLDDDDAARTPHGDSNFPSSQSTSLSKDAARAPHGDSNL